MAKVSAEEYAKNWNGEYQLRHNKGEGFLDLLKDLHRYNDHDLHTLVMRQGPGGQEMEKTFTQNIIMASWRAWKYGREDFSAVMEELVKHASETFPYEHPLIDEWKLTFKHRIYDQQLLRDVEED